MRRNFWVAIVAVLVLIAAGGKLFELRRHGGGEAPQAVAPPPQPPAPAAQPAEAPPPSFDAVHVGQDGQAVIAGRAAPGAQVTVLDRGEPVGHATADANGEWVVMTDRPLAPGPQELTLAARGPAGEERRSSASVAVVVPEHGAAQPPVAVLLPQGGGAARALGARDARAQHQVALDIVEYDPAGRTLLSGRADPGAAVDVLINGKRLVTTTADGGGEWTATLAAGVPLGRYRLRLQGHAPGGGDVGDVAFEMRRAGPDELGPGGAFSVVPGNNLWHLARRSYGDGLRYVEIYRANRERIDNPDRIYPGQLLALPNKS